MALIKPPGRTALEDVQAEGPMVHIRCHDLVQHTAAEALAVESRFEVEVLNPHGV